MSNCHFLTLFTPMHTSFLLEVENVVTGSWSPVTKDTYCFLLVLDRVNLRKVTWWVRLSSHILLLTNHWVQAGYACPAWFPRIRVCTKISNSAGRSSQGRWWWKCPTQLENNVPHSSERKLTRLSRLVLLTLNIPNNIQFKDGVQVLKLGTDLLHLERSANSSPWPTDAIWCGMPPSTSPHVPLSNHTALLSGPFLLSGKEGSFPPLDLVHFIPSSYKCFPLAICMVKISSYFRAPVLRESFTEHPV